MPAFPSAAARRRRLQFCPQNQFSRHAPSQSLRSSSSTPPANAQMEYRPSPGEAERPRRVNRASSLLSSPVTMPRAGERRFGCRLPERERLRQLRAERLAATPTMRHDHAEWIMIPAAATARSVTCRHRAGSRPARRMSSLIQRYSSSRLIFIQPCAAATCVADATRRAACPRSRWPS